MITVGTNAALTQIAREKAETGFTDHGLNVKETEALGVAIAGHFEFSGDPIVETFLAALVDANYHSFAETVKDAWEAEWRNATATRVGKGGV